ncbi:MAG: helix-turn-helix domain-containing protein [Blautia sp.]|nr:helix-turn-helix domain-containing protein [Blautia sp.]
MVIEMHSVGARIQQMREKAGLSQEQLADYLDIGKERMAGIEEGDRMPSSWELERLSALFCCPIPAMLSDGEGMPAYAAAPMPEWVCAEDLEAAAAVGRIALNTAWMAMLLADMQG